MNSFKTVSVLFVVLFFLPHCMLVAQVKIGDNPTTVNAGSLLELESSTANKGVLFPRISITSTTTWGMVSGSTAVAGMVVYNSNTAITAGSTSYPALTGGKGFYYWDGTDWVGITPLSAITNQFWGLTGNSGTNSGLNFLGTTDNHPLRLKVNGQQAGFIDSAGGLGKTFLGYQAGLNNSTGYGNTALGASAAIANNTGYHNTIAGDSAALNGANSNSNAALGAFAFYNSSAGSGNTAIGDSAAYAYLGGGNNVAVGFKAGAGGTAGGGNTFAGAFSATGYVSGANNSFFGYASGLSGSSGGFNTLIGDSTAAGAYTGANNTFVGHAAGYNYAGGNNTFIGYGAGYGGGYASSNNNTAVGYQAGLSNISGGNNTFLGYGADALQTSLTNSAAIGYKTKVNASNALVLGSSAAFGTQVKVGIGTPTPQALLDVEDSSLNLTTIGQFVGSNNSSMQLYLQNRSNGAAASTDFVATQNGTFNNNHYIDLGINSSANTSNTWGYKGGSYIYSNLDTFRIGTASSMPLIFNTGSGSPSNGRMVIDQYGRVGINVTAPAKRVDINASTVGVGSSTGTYDYLHVTNLAIDSALTNGTQFNSTYSQPLVIDTLNHLVGVSTVSNVAGQILRFGLNGSSYTYQANDQMLRFNNSDTTTTMGLTGTGTQNFINNIAGSKVVNAASVVGGGGVPTGTWTADEINLPAGTYQVSVKMLGTTGGSVSTNPIGIKFLIASQGTSGQTINEYNNFPGFVTSSGGTFFVSDLVSSATPFALSLSINVPANLFSSFTITGAVPVQNGTGNAWRSVVLITRLR